MGALGGLTGTAGGQSGTGVQGPSAAPIVNPTNATQISGAYTGAQNSLQSQQQLLQALQAQNGLANQNQVYGQLQGVANGTGPNPAQTMLNQSTGANVANQAALMAGQRGAASNVGLMARQAAMQGANTQQQAAGQAATLQANQSLNAINSAGGIANAQTTNQIGQTNANTQAQQAEQQALLGAQSNANSANVSSQNSINAANAGLATTTMQGQQALVGGGLQGAGAALAMMADGGPVGDVVNNVDPGYVAPAASSAFQGPQSKFGQFLNNVGQNSQDQIDSAPPPTTSSGALQQGTSKAISGLASALMGAQGGMVPALVSPGEKYLSPREVEAVEKGADPMKVGETISGKPKVGGAKNSYANDFVPKKLEIGGIVVPRSETKSKNPHRNSADFVMKTLAKRKVGR